METVNFTLVRGTAPRLRFRLTTPEDVSSWTTTFEVRTTPAIDGTPTYSHDGVIANPDEVPQSSTLGVFDVPVSATDSKTFTTGRSYYFLFRRTNPGFEDILTRGVMTVS